MHLHDLPDDVIICLFEQLDVPQILVFRQTCKRMHKISELRSVWINAYNNQILRPCHPFPTDVAIDTLPASDLECHVRRAFLLATRWLSDGPLCCGVHCEFDATNGTPVSDLRFLPGHGGTRIIAVSTSIWPIIALWELSDSGAPPLKRFEWSNRDSLLHNYVINSDKTADAALAVSVNQGGDTHVEILSIHEELGFRSLGRIDSTLTPVYFHRDLLVLCDDKDKSVVMNWKSGVSAILRRPESVSQIQTGIGINDRCIQVMVLVAGILVIRERSLSLFANPTLTTDPPVVHAPILPVRYFGWLDGVAAAPILSSRSIEFNANSPPPLSVLIRPELDDPWAADDHKLDLYVLHPEPTFPLSTTRPYMFPPVLTAQVPSLRGSLQCSDLRLGAHGTAIWIEPQDRSSGGLLADAHAPVVRQNERLVGAVFPGPLFREWAGDPVLGATPISVRGRTLHANELNNWNALDYDEARGRVAIGSTRGRITILSLAELHPSC
ncbi:F-box domain-containing protein [Mycena sanguinolenta]|uniref:F-box domain-containing protein n=1 Tax=Mycena sanguinolenta TaxID=230812 RepID=A0A8H6YBF2_9AGAR|nr:F-box domain-containing protein [Mycena sanguinolenta]